MEGSMNQLYESAGLFEVTVPEFKQLKACRRDTIMLKSLWDMIFLVQSSFADWETTLWASINVEQMDMDCKKFVKDIRSLDKEMRAWDAFTGKDTVLYHLHSKSIVYLLGLDATVKNMVTSLRAVGELQNPAIRDRHWLQLMQATQVLSLTINPPSRLLQGCDIVVTGRLQPCYKLTVHVHMHIHVFTNDVGEICHV